MPTVEGRRVKAECPPHWRVAAVADQIPLWWVARTFRSFVHRLEAFKTGHKFDRCYAIDKEGFVANPANTRKKDGLFWTALSHNSKPIER
jgi:hypothetical protein